MYEELVRLFLKSIRGELDCMAMSKELGFSYNWYFKVENSYKKLSFDDFVLVSKLKSKSILSEVLKSELNIELSSFDQKTLIDSYCDLFGEPSKTILEEVLKFSTSKWWRIRNNKSKLFLSDFLNLIDNSGNDAFSFISKLIGGNEKIDKNIKAQFKEVQASFLEKNPDASFLMVALYEKQYIENKKKHQIETLQKVSGIEKDRFLFLFNELIRLRIIYYDRACKKYVRTEFKTESRSHKSYELSKSLYINGIEKQIKYLKQDLDPSRISFGVKVMTLTPEAYQEIKKEQRKMYDKISHIIENEKGKDNREMAIFQFGTMLLPSLGVEEISKIEK